MSFAGFTNERLQALLTLVQNGDLPFPPSGFALAKHGMANPDALATSLAQYSRSALLHTLQALLDQREALARPPSVLAFTGPPTQTSPAKSTRDVLQEMLMQAESDVLVAGYAFSEHTKGIFEPLCARMQENPRLRVRLVLHVESSASHYARSPQDFLQRIWPRGAPLPHEILTPCEGPDGKRPTMHAKCAVVDHRHVLITSANFTERAQTKNIEMGVRLDDVALANAIHAQWQALVEVGALEKYR